MHDRPEDFCRLLLFRHPELAPDDAVRAVGRGDAALGRRGNQAMATWLGLLADVPVDAVWTGPQRHCSDPAMAIAAGKGLEPMVDERLADQALGEWEGRTWDELAAEDPDRVREFFQEFGEAVAPGGESLGMAVERMLEWWTEVRGDAVGKILAVVASGSLQAGFAAAMLGMRLSRAVSLQLPPAGFGVLDVYGNGVRVTTWNPTGWAAD